MVLRFANFSAAKDRATPVSYNWRQIISLRGMINRFSIDEEFSYDKRIKLLRQRKIKQTEEKAGEGGADEDDYGLIAQYEFNYELVPNHPNGSDWGKVNIFHVDEKVSLIELTITLPALNQSIKKE